MEIVGLLTVALVAGTIARTLYAGTMPSDIAPSLLAGAIGVAAGFALATLTGLEAMTSPAHLTTWLSALTGACLAVAAGDALRTVAPPLRHLGRAT